jgi:hypothetical protein
LPRPQFSDRLAPVVTPSKPIINEQPYAHLFVDDTLKDVSLCGKIYKTKQIFIDGIDVIPRIAEIIKEMEQGSEEQAKIAKATCGNIEAGNLQTNDADELGVYGPVNRVEESSKYYMGIGKFLSFAISIPDLQIEVSKAEEGSSRIFGRLRENTPIDDKTSHFENQYIGIGLDYPSNLYADGQNDFFQVTFMAPDDTMRHSSASMGALAFALKENQTVAEVIEQLKPNTFSIKDSTVGGRKAKEITSTSDGYSGSIWIYTLVETKRGVLQINFLRDTDRAPIYRSVIDSIRFFDEQ